MLSIKSSILQKLAAAFVFVTLAIGIFFVLWQLEILSDVIACYLALAFLLILLVRSWYCFSGGVHIVFLFLSMLLVFQCGRIVGAVLGAVQNPFLIEIQTFTPFQVSRSTKGITLLLISISAWLTYIPCRLFYRPQKIDVKGYKNLLLPLYLILALTAPFLFYKNYMYLQYIRSHGGYFAIYLDYDGVMSSVGNTIRIVALVGLATFFLIYIIEQRKKVLGFVTFVFTASYLADLLIGFRGKVFTIILILWLIRNLKEGKRFSRLVLVSVAVILSVVGVITASFRESRKMDSLNPLLFLVGQGISLNVTECSVEDRAMFYPYRWSYIFYDLESPFRSVRKFKPGQLFDQDLSTFLNPISYSWGAGTGSSYLAEAYIVGGLLGVILASLALGLLFAWIHSTCGSLWGGIVLVCFGQTLIYLPRSGLLEPISSGIKMIIPILLVLVVSRTVVRKKFASEKSFDF